MRRVLTFVGDVLAAVLGSCLLLFLLISFTGGICYISINDAKVETVKFHLEDLRKSILAFRAQTGKLPSSLDDLVPDYMQRLPRDAWDVPYQYQVSQAGCTIGSLGEDRVVGGEGVNQDLSETILSQ